MIANMTVGKEIKFECLVVTERFVAHLFSATPSLQTYQL